MALSYVFSFCTLFGILVGLTVAARTTTGPPTSPPVQGIPETVLNPYCNFSVYQLLTEVYQPVDMKCANPESSTLEDNYQSSFFPISYMQADNGSMSRAIEDALKKVKQRIPKKELMVNMDVNAFHPLSYTRRYAEIVAVIDISNKLTSSLGAKDSVSIKVEHAGMRFDSKNTADNRIKMFAANNVVLLNWDYLVGAPSVY